MNVIKCRYEYDNGEVKEWPVRWAITKRMAGATYIHIEGRGTEFDAIIGILISCGATVHFLNQVDEADILANMEEEDQAAYDEWKAGIDERKAALEAEQNALDGKPSEDTGTAKDGESDAENPDKKASAKTSSIIIVAVFVVAGVGYLVYKIMERLAAIM